jgi:hypothetical protein
MDRAVWQAIADKWEIVMMAPQAFGAALFAGGVVGWLLARTIYNNRLTHHQELSGESFRLSLWTFNKFIYGNVGAFPPRF